MSILFLSSPNLKYKVGGRRGGSHKTVIDGNSTATKNHIRKFSLLAIQSAARVKEQRQNEIIYRFNLYIQRPCNINFFHLIDSHSIMNPIIIDIPRCNNYCY